ncbi:MAG: hypothetical protein LBK73_15365 [Treponema sp.]|jgi:hypothetical protein|nr:hypothetical protein [Treponema sp.]
MSKGVSDKITYKPYDRGRAYLIPPRVDEIIPENHLARLVGEVIDGMGIERLLRNCRAGGGAARVCLEGSGGKGWQGIGREAAGAYEDGGRRVRRREPGVRR